MGQIYGCPPLTAHALKRRAVAGADILFVEPASKAGDIGVTVSPVRIKSLEQFGNLTAVGDRLLAAERSKVSIFLLLDAMAPDTCRLLTSLTQNNQ